MAKEKSGSFSLLLTIGALWVLGRCGGDWVTRPAAALSAIPTPAAAQTALVVWVADGDTIRVMIGEREYAVRYIGVDAAEMGEPDGAAARQQNADLVGGKIVRLEKDVSETDRYGRLLRYVWVGDRMVNAELVRLGYARAAAYPPDIRHQALLEAQQRDAQAAGRGMWAIP